MADKQTAGYVKAVRETDFEILDTELDRVEAELALLKQEKETIVTGALFYQRKYNALRKAAGVAVERIKNNETFVSNVILAQPERLTPLTQLERIWDFLLDIATDLEQAIKTGEGK